MASRAMALRRAIGDLGDDATGVGAGEEDADERRANASATIGEDGKDTAGVLRWMVKTTDEMLDDMEAREPAVAIAAWEISKRAEKVAANPAVRGTAEVVGRVSVAAARAAAPVVAQGAATVVREGGKLAVQAVVRAAAARAGFDTIQKDNERERERSRDDAKSGAGTRTMKTTSSGSSSSGLSSKSSAGNAAARVLGAFGAKKKPEPPKTEEKKKRFFSL